MGLPSTCSKAQCARPPLPTWRFLRASLKSREWLSFLCKRFGGKILAKDTRQRSTVPPDLGIVQWHFNLKLPTPLAMTISTSAIAGPVFLRCLSFASRWLHQPAFDCHRSESGSVHGLPHGYWSVARIHFIRHSQSFGAMEVSD